MDTTSRPETVHDDACAAAARQQQACPLERIVTRVMNDDSGSHNWTTTEQVITTTSLMPNDVYRKTVHQFTLSLQSRCHDLLSKQVTQYTGEK